MSFIDKVVFYCVLYWRFYRIQSSETDNTVKTLYNGHIGPCKTGPYNEVASLLR